MSLFPLAFGVCFIWFANIVWMVREFIQHTPNWKDEDVTSEEIIQNFMANTPLERLEFIRKVAEFNPLIGMTGLALIALAFII